MSGFSSWLRRGAACLVAAGLWAGAASATTIGPDAAGYTASDTGPFAWDEISGTGTRIFAGVDDQALPVAVGFTFQFYGTNYTTVYATSNGTITFGAPNPSYAPHNNLTTDPAPTQFTPFNLPMIAPLWQDLYFGGSGADATYYQTLGSPGSRRLVIEFHNQAQCCNSMPTGFVTYEVILYEGSNNISLQYLDITTTESINNGGNSTIGIRDTDGHLNNRRLQWSFNSATLSDNKAILFTAPACANAGCTVCGNGVLEAGEQCDDGNDRNDGCSVACKLEPCTGELIRTVDSAGDAGDNGIAIAIPSDGRPVISYTDLTAQSLKVARCGNVSCDYFTYATVDSSANVGQCSSMVIGSDGFPFIVYRDDSAGAVKVKAAHCTDVACAAAADIRILDNTNSSGCANSVSVGSDGFPLVTYYATAGGLRTVHCSDVSCSAQTAANVDPASTTGRNNSIVRGADNVGLLSYTDSSAGSLRAAHCNNANCTAVTATTLESSGVVDTDTSIAIGTDNLGVISYRNAAGLRLGHCSNTNCTSATLTTVDGSSGHGSYSSVAISGGVPYISYYDSTSGDLWMARCLDASCTTSSKQMVDSTNDVGKFSALAVTSSGKRYASYYDAGNTAVKVVVCGQCGDGIVQGTEQCDDGASNGTSTSCCTATCSYRASGQVCRPASGECDVAETCTGTSNSCPANGFVSFGTACTDDGNLCTNDQCNGGGSCTHPNNSAPCNDGLFCNGTDTCSGGGCNSHTGNPCTGGAACNNVCNEAADNCLNTAGSSCPDDGNVCTNDQCDGSGACTHPNNTAPCASDGNGCTDDVCAGGGCTHPNNTAPCNDGLYCNGTDTCSGGTCSSHSGDPCSGGPDCQNICNESADNCLNPPASPCSTDGSPCTADSCDGSGNCQHLDTPAISCLSAGKAQLNLKQVPSQDDKDAVSFSWSGGPQLTQGSFGNPVTTDNFSLCIYDANGLVMESAVAGGTMCGDDTCWKANKTVGFKYKDKTGSSDGITSSAFTGGEAGKSKLNVKGKGSNLPDPTLGLTAPVTAQFRRADNGICFGATFSGSEIKKNDSEQFKGKGQ